MCFFLSGGRGLPLGYYERCLRPSVVSVAVLGVVDGVPPDNWFSLASVLLAARPSFYASLPRV